MSAQEKKDFDSLVDEHVQIALAEIGPIEPWYDEDVQAWVFEHQLYPVEYGGDTKREVIKNFPLYIREFVEHRLRDNLAPFVEARTIGRGGKREGAGRPKGSVKGPPTKTVRLPADVAAWLKEDESHVERVRRLMTN